MLKDARTLVLVLAPVLVLVLVLLSTRTSYARTRPSAMSAALSWLGFATQWVPRRYGRLMTLRSVQCAVGWCMLTKTAGAGTVHAFSTTGGEAITLCVRPVPVPSELVHVWWQPLLIVLRSHWFGDPPATDKDSFAQAKDSSACQSQLGASQFIMFIIKNTKETRLNTGVPSS